MIREKTKKPSWFGRIANLMTTTTIAQSRCRCLGPTRLCRIFSCIGEKTMIVTAAKTTACSPLGHSVKIQNSTVAPTPKNTRKALTRAGR
jgi:hypothetical protein